MEEEIKSCFVQVKQDLESQETQEPTDEDNESSPFVPKPLSSTIMAGMAKRESNLRTENEITSCTDKDTGCSDSFDETSYNCVTRWVVSLKKKWGNLTRRQIVILTLFGLVDLLAATIISIQAPFYPEVASSKGASATEYGLVFGIFEFTAIVFSPIFGANVQDEYSGILITGSSAVIFGLLYKIEGSSTFIGWCLFVRVLEAIGESDYVTASFTVIAMEFPDAVATTFAILETCYGFGLIAGPLLGGVLYDLGGYSLPFICLGGTLFVSALVSCFVVPSKGVQNIDKLNESTNETESGTSQADSSQKILVKASTSGMYGLICIPSVALTSYGIVATATGVGFLCALLEPHLRQFEIGKVTIGSVFILSGGVYAFTAPFWGWLCDNDYMNPKNITILGSLFSIVGFCLIGPLPFVPIDTILWVTCVGLVLSGLGLGAVYVSGFSIYLTDAIKRGYPDDVSTYGFVSGLWTSMVSLGYGIGPTVGGVLEDHVGFRLGTLFVLGAQLFLLAFLSIHAMMKSAKPTSNSESGFPTPVSNQQEIKGDNNG